MSRDSSPVGNVVVTGKVANRTEKTLRDVSISFVLFDAQGASAYTRV